MSSVSTSSPSPAPTTALPAPCEEPLADFAPWLLAQLNVATELRGQSLAVALDEPDRKTFDGQAELLVALSPTGDGQAWD